MSDTLQRNAVEGREATPGVIDRLVADFQAKRGLYIGGIVGIFVILFVTLMLLDGSADDRVDSFSPVWDAYASVRVRVQSNLPATDALAQLDAELSKARGTDAEASALWLSAIGQYASAFTHDKLDSAQRAPLLEGAKERLQELSDSRFDHFLPALTRWFTASGSPPVDQLLARVTQDLEWLSENEQTQPKADAAPTAVLRTDLGDIHLRFFGALAPKHRDNFISLATKGSYNGTAFHFVRDGDPKKGVVAGDPFTYFYNNPLKKDHIMRWGAGGTGYSLPPEEARFRVAHAHGIVTAQRRQNADWDNGSQFQILTSTDPTLDRVYTPFAEVVEGMDVVEKIVQRKTAAQHGPYRDDPLFQRLDRSGLLVEPVWIQKVVVYGQDGNALEHAFPLVAEAASLEALNGSTVVPLEGGKLAVGRKLRDPKSAEEFRRGLDFPFPDDLKDLADASADGDRRVLEDVEPGGSAQPDKDDDPKKGDPEKGDPEKGDTEEGDTEKKDDGAGDDAAPEESGDPKQDEPKDDE